MKYNDNGTIKNIVVKSGDTLPIGTIVDFDGTTIPDGYEIIQTDDETSVTSSSGTLYYTKKGNLVVVSGWYYVGGSSVNLPTAPYKPIHPVWSPITGVTSSSQPNAYGRMTIWENGDSALEFNSSTHYAVVNAVYFTND